MTGGNEAGGLKVDTPTICPICGDEFPGWKSGNVHEHCLRCDLHAMKGERIEYGDKRHGGLREPEELGPPIPPADRHQLQLMPRREPCQAAFRCRCPWHTGPNPVGENMRATAHVPWGWCGECATQIRWELWQRDAFAMRTPRPNRIRILRSMGYSQAEITRLAGLTRKEIRVGEQKIRPLSLARIAV